VLKKLKRIKHNKIIYKRIRYTRLVYFLFIVELATCFDSAGSSSGFYVNQVMLKNCVHLWDPIDLYKGYIYISCLRLIIYLETIFFLRNGRLK
jgi:hypothetical protein